MMSYGESVFKEDVDRLGTYRYHNMPTEPIHSSEHSLLIPLPEVYIALERQELEQQMQCRS